MQDDKKHFTIADTISSIFIGLFVCSLLMIPMFYINPFLWFLIFIFVTGTGYIIFSLSFIIMAIILNKKAPPWTFTELAKKYDW